MQVDEASSEIVRVPITNERQVFEEYTDVRHTGSGRHSQALTVSLVVTLREKCKKQWKLPLKWEYMPHLVTKYKIFA